MSKNNSNFIFILIYKQRMYEIFLLQHKCNEILNSPVSLWNIREFILFSPTSLIVDYSKWIFISIFPYFQIARFSNQPKGTHVFFHPPTQSWHTPSQPNRQAFSLTGCGVKSFSFFLLYRSHSLTFFISFVVPFHKIISPVSYTSHDIMLSLHSVQPMNTCEMKEAHNQLSHIFY